MGTSCRHSTREATDGVDQVGAVGHVVIRDHRGEDLGHVAMLGSIASDGVDAEGPGSHVGEQRDQEGDADDLKDHGIAHNSLDSVDHAVVGIDGIGRHSSADAKASEQVDHGDGQAADDDSLGDIASGSRPYRRSWCR